MAGVACSGGGLQAVGRARRARRPSVRCVASSSSSSSSRGGGHPLLDEGRFAAEGEAEADVRCVVQGPAPTVRGRLLLASGVRAVRVACEVTRRVQGRLASGEVSRKADESPVTVADFAAQAVVHRMLATSGAFHSLGHGFVAEEDAAELRAEVGASTAAAVAAEVNAALASAALPPMGVAELLHVLDQGGHPGGPEGTHWVLDPIDGTKGFVRGDQYAVCLGVVQEGALTVGILGCPNLERRYAFPGDDGVGLLLTAVAGRGAWAQRLGPGGDGDSDSAAAVRLDLGARPRGGRSGPLRFMESVESAHSNHGVSRAVADALAMDGDPLRIDSQCKYGVLAMGGGDVFMRFPPASYREKIWDHAAGVLIVHEAGGVVTNARGEPLDFSQSRWLDGLKGGIVAAGDPETHARVVAAASRALDAVARG